MSKKQDFEWIGYSWSRPRMQQFQKNDQNWIIIYSTAKEKDRGN